MLIASFCICANIKQPESVSFMIQWSLIYKVWIDVFEQNEYFVFCHTRTAQVSLWVTHGFLSHFFSSVSISHLYFHDSKVWHWGVVQSHTRVWGVLDTWENFGGCGGRAVVQHLTQRVDVDVFGGEASPYGVVRARHALHTVWKVHLW